VHRLCVLKGDIYGFGGMMQANTEVPVRQALEDAVRHWARRAVVAQTSAGDSVLIIHEDPVALAQTARHIVDEVYQATGQPLLRMALHYGEVQMQPSVDNQPPMIVGGNAILTAARVEPHVAPGQIWATEEFRQVLAERPSLWRTSHVAAPDGGEAFNVKRREGRSPTYGSDFIGSNSDASRSGRKARRRFFPASRHWRPVRGRRKRAGRGQSEVPKPQFTGPCYVGRRVSASRVASNSRKRCNTPGASPVAAPTACMALNSLTMISKPTIAPFCAKRRAPPEGRNPVAAVKGEYSRTGPRQVSVQACLPAPNRSDCTGR